MVNEMNNQVITKTIAKVESLKNEYSLGFARLHALPTKARKAFNLASILKGTAVNSIHREQKDFMQSLSDAEFVTWLKVNA